MIFQFDNIIAAMITAAVVVMVLSFQRQGQDVAADTSRYFTAKKDELSLVEMVKHDFQNMIADLSKGPHISEKTDSTIRFAALADDEGTVAAIRYQRKRTDTAPDGTELYTIERYVDGVKTGSNRGRTVEFEVKLFTDSGEEITTPSRFNEVTTIGVRTAGTSPFGQGDFVQRTRWSAIFRPARVVPST